MAIKGGGEIWEGGWKIGGEKHESNKKKHVLGRKKSSLDFIKSDQLHNYHLGEDRTMRKKA